MSDKVVSVGDDFRAWPRRHWGSRDRQVAAAVDAQLRASEHWQLATPEPEHTVIGFGGLYGSEQSRRRQREHEVRRLLDKYGLL